MLLLEEQSGIASGAGAGLQTGAEPRTDPVPRGADPIVGWIALIVPLLAVFLCVAVFFIVAAVA